MRTRTGSTCLIALLIATGVAAAQNPSTGTRRLNPPKSKSTGDIMKFERTSSGEIRWSGAGLSYTFKFDGKEYLGPFGKLIAWKQIDDHTWENTVKQKGESISTDTSKLSPDGKTMTVISRGTKPNGEPFENASVYDRTSGDCGLFGTWKKRTPTSAPPGQ